MTRSVAVQPKQATPELLDALGDGAGYLPLNLTAYHALLRAGLLPENNDFELIRGVIVAKRPLDAQGTQIVKNPRHGLSNDRLLRHAMVLDPQRYHISGQNPVSLPDDGEPEPDVAILIGPDTRYAERKPGPDDIYCVVEISDVTLRRDRGLKMQLYAQARLPYYVIVNLQDNQVELHGEPLEEEQRYQYRQVLRPGDELVIPLRDRDELRIPVADLLP